MKARIVSSPDDPDTSRAQVQHLAEFWSQLRVCGEKGAATWEELDGLEREVTDCLAKKPPDVKRAESLTAYAMLLIAGCSGQ